MLGSRLRRFAAWMLRPVHRRLLQYIPVEDPWELVTSRFVAPNVFGPGSRRQFSWYLEGESAVNVTAVDDVCQWLFECQYLPDTHLFQEIDHWQHPVTFEHLRKGDCEDHALWAWRKLIELGHRPQFFVGQWLTGGGDHLDLHAWVVFERDGERMLFEATVKDRDGMVRPLRELREAYRPHFSVDYTFTMRAHEGYLLYSKECARRG